MRIILNGIEIMYAVGKEFDPNMKLKSRFIIRILALLWLVIFIAITWAWFDKQELAQLWHKLAMQPYWLLFMFFMYLTSFILKAEAWRRYVEPREPLRVYFHGLIYSLLVNHLSPLKVGDLVRTGVLMKATGKTWDDALHSVAAMRLLDLFILGLFAGVGTVWFGLEASWLWIFLLLFGVIVAGFGYKMIGIKRLPFLQKHLSYLNATLISSKGRSILALVAVSWICEAGVIYGVIQILKLHLPFISMIWVNSITIAGQVFHITPGAIGTYESTLSGSLVVLGIDWKDAYAAAILSHGFKFIFSYSLGLYSFIRMPIKWNEIKLWFTHKKGV
ncbi:UPF0104 family protein [Paenibacillus psychroresistens]|uniref:Phosphatidylglycerol lysyltransferase n=2 Tax=Paenibacillus psychroresistens TaxID=1778678 RepID=A0A6B8RIZ1_9BACL|nr:UPF0104 family protein [Paenibacillus psychroresistens]